MLDCFFSLNIADKIALFALVVALYGAILSTILYRKETLKINFIYLGVNFLTLSSTGTTSDNVGIHYITYDKNLYTVAILVRINNRSKNSVTITDFMLNNKYMFNSFSSREFTYIPTSFKTINNFLVPNSYKNLESHIIQPIIKIEPLSTCEGFILFSNIDKIPKKFKITINTVQKAKTFKFDFVLDKDFRNNIKDS